MPITLSGDGVISGITATGISAVQNLPATGTITNLTTTTISDGTNSTSSTNVIRGSAKAWVNLNMSTSAITSSFNISSVTKNGTGNFTVTLINVPSLNYCAVSGSTSNGTNGSDMCVVYPNFSSNTFKIMGFYAGDTTNRDIVGACAALFA